VCTKLSAAHLKYIYIYINWYVEKESDVHNNLERELIHLGLINLCKHYKKDLEVTRSDVTSRKDLVARRRHFRLQRAEAEDWK
jgi:hypothetical protein